MSSIEYNLSGDPHWTEVGGYRAGDEVSTLAGLREDFEMYSRPKLQKGMGPVLIVDDATGTHGMLVQPICGKSADGFPLRSINAVELDGSLGSRPFIVSDGHTAMFAEPMPATLVGGSLSGGRAKKAKRSAKGKSKSPKRSAKGKGKSPKRKSKSPRRG